MIRRWFMDFLWRRASNHGRAIARLLHDDPEGWEIDRHRLKHNAARINLWTANEAAWSIRLDPHSVEDGVTMPKLNWFDRQLIWRAAASYKYHDDQPQQIVHRIDEVLRQKEKAQ